MALELHTPRTSRSATRDWPSIALASAQLCRPHLRVVDPLPEIQLGTSAVLSLAAISIRDGAIALDGLLDAAAAGTTLDINSNPIRVHPSGDFSTVFDLHGRTALTVTIKIPLSATTRGDDKHLGAGGRIA